MPTTILLAIAIMSVAYVLYSGHATFTINHTYRVIQETQDNPLDPEIAKLLDDQQSDFSNLPAALQATIHDLMEEGGTDGN